MSNDHQLLIDDIFLLDDNVAYDPPFPATFSHQYHENVIPSMPDQNYNSVNLNVEANQNPPVYKPLAIQTPSKYPLTDNISIPKELEGISYDFFDDQGNVIVWNEGVQDHGFVNGGHEINFDQTMVHSQPMEFVGPNNPNVTNKEIPNQVEDQVVENIPSEKVYNNKSRWTKKEDKALLELVERYGTIKWSKISKKFEGRRSGKQCRERWHNNLRPDIKKEDWTEEEYQVLIEVHKIVGNKWTKIAEKLLGRSENTIKNHWNAAKRRIQAMKIKQEDDNSLEKYIRSIVAPLDDAFPKSASVQHAALPTSEGDFGDIWDDKWIANI